jgi:tripartite-type tricarboxylate transporter receptor subunit TctC
MWPLLLTRSVFVGLSIVGAGVAAAQSAATGSGQAYPTKSVRMVVSGVAGSSNITARLIAPGLSDSLGQQVLVDGREGGVIVSDMVAKAPADGYTLLLNGSAMWLLPFMRSNVPYDPVKDFAPITLAVSAPNNLVLHPTVAAKSVKEFIALVKAKPGELNCATGNAGTSNHLAAELFKAMTGANFVRIPYKGAAPAITDLLGGQVQLMFASASSVTSHIKSGKLRALAVSSLQPSELAPGLPTIAASGVPGYESVAIFGVLAPAKTPAALVKRLNQEIVRVLTSAAVKERFFNAGSEVVASTPLQFAEAIKSEMSRMGKVIKDAGIRDE